MLSFETTKVGIKRVTGNLKSAYSWSKRSCQQKINVWKSNCPGARVINRDYNLTHDITGQITDIVTCGAS